MGSSKQFRNVPEPTISVCAEEQESIPDTVQVQRLQALALLDLDTAGTVVRRCPQVGSIADSAIASRMVLLKRAFPGTFEQLDLCSSGFAQRSLLYFLVLGYMSSNGTFCRLLHETLPTMCVLLRRFWFRLDETSHQSL